VLRTLGLTPRGCNCSVGAGSPRIKVIVAFRELERVTSRRSAALALPEDVEDGALYAAMVHQEVATVDEEGKGDELTWSKNVQEKTKTTRSVEAPLARECGRVA